MWSRWWDPMGLMLLFVVALASPASSQGKVWRIGLFHVGLDHVPPSLEPLRQELRTLGYQEGRNLQLDWRNLPDEDAANETAKEFARARVDLIVAFENQTVRAAKAATADIPVVFLHPTDPVADGFIQSMARPGGNITGFSGQADVPAKEIELFKDLVPGLRRLLVLVDPQDPVVSRRLVEMRRAAAVLKLQLAEREAVGAADVERVIGNLKPGEVGGIVAASYNTRVKFTQLMLRLASEKRLPLHVHRKEWVEQGALFTYAPDFAPVGVRAAHYIDRILKGTKPADLPAEDTTAFMLVINLKTASALGLVIPQAMLLRANAVVQ